jgi:hypothetical protein
MKDHEFRTEFERAGREIAATDTIVNTLSSLRGTRGVRRLS